MGHFGMIYNHCDYLHRGSKVLHMDSNHARKRTSFNSGQMATKSSVTSTPNYHHLCHNFLLKKLKKKEFLTLLKDYLAWQM